MKSRSNVARVLDANFNRAREGLRVCEEAARLVLEDPRLTRRCQRIRYGLTLLTARWPQRGLLSSRDLLRDAGRPALRGKARRHQNLRELVRSNAQRTEEAIRVVEEFSRLQSPALTKRFSSLRFRVYALEKALLSRL